MTRRILSILASLSVLCAACESTPVARKPSPSSAPPTHSETPTTASENTPAVSPSPSPSTSEKTADRLSLTQSAEAATLSEPLPPDNPPTPAPSAIAQDSTSPIDATRILDREVILTPTEVEEMLEELKAETTIEGIKFNLPEHILFEFDKYYVLAAAKPSLEKIHQLLQHFRDAQLFVYGHSDSKGDAHYNQQLSEKRAAAVKYYFINQFDVEPTRIQTKGMGETQPLADNYKPDGTDNPEGRKKNRRVEFIIKTEPRAIASLSPSELFQEGLNTAMNAAVLTQKAKTAPAWQQVATQWEEAIALMQAVPESSDNYQTAQQKVIEYQKNLNYARQNAE